MKKKIFGGIAVLAIAATAAWNVNFNSQKSNLISINLNGIEVLAAENCISNSKNTGTCKNNVGSEGVSCVTASSGDTKNCTGV